MSKPNNNKWYDEEIMDMKTEYWDKLESGSYLQSFCIDSESEYHKAIVRKESGEKSNPAFFMQLAAGKI